MSMSVRLLREMPQAGELVAAIVGTRRLHERRYEITDQMITVDWSSRYHHTSLPAVVALDTLIDREAAIAAHQKVRLLDFLASVPAMDESQQKLLAAAGGAPVAGRAAPAFAQHVFALVERPALQPFFNNEHVLPDVPKHYAVRPTDPLLLPRGRNGLPEVDRVLLVTIVALYNIALAREVFKRHWNPTAAEACALMNSVRNAPVESVRLAVTNWYGLMATYPGW